jgi:hypothetical protein
LDFSLLASLGLSLEDYILNDVSSFLDIGSGFGMAVWHTFAVATCLSVGLEIVPNRHDFAVASFDLLMRNTAILSLHEKVADARRRNRVQFRQDDAASGSVDPTNEEQALPYVTEKGTHFSHIFSFNLVFTEVDLLNIAERLNATNFKVLVWC